MLRAILAARNRAIAAARNRVIAAPKVHRRGMCAGGTPKPPVTLEDLGSMLLSLKQDVKKGLKSLNSRLGSVEQKLGHSLEYQVRLEVAREFGRAYAEQDTVDCIVNLVAHIPRRILPEAPESPDIHSKVIHTARMVAEHLISHDIPRKFIHALVEHLGLDHSTILQPGGMNLVPIRQHKLVAGNWTAITQLEDYFKLKKKKEQTAFLPTCKGPGVLFLVYMACPHAIFRSTEVLSLYTELEFDFRGRINLFIKQTEVNGTIEVAECKSNIRISEAISQLGLRLDVLKSLIETVMFVRHQLKKREKAKMNKVNAEATGKAGKAPKAHLTKIGRLFVPKAIVSLDDCKVEDSAKELALERGFSFHLHRL